MVNNAIREYGFTAVPSSAAKLFDIAGLSSREPPSAYPVSSTPVPETALARRIQAYARAHLAEPTFNHSMRVYHYGLAIKRYLFPDWAFSDETYFLTCMLHDIGTTKENLRATRMSFEFYGGILALNVLQHATDGNGASAVAPVAQAESISEAIIRHQDLCEIGKITAVGQLIQLATIFDNTGMHSEAVHSETIKDAVKHFPRLKWSSCFAATVREENQLKPWAHTTTLGEEEFPAKILGNKFNKELESE
ncbi:hypothetical protein FQN57_006087 [Myotisia sp. PD_48]|nr:hypothetical protein FQN57_006087 [Myotisia sp. PD_48]